MRPVVQAMLPAFLVALLTLSATGDEPADLIVRGGQIITVDAANPAAEALAVRDARFVRVGSRARVEELIGPKTRVIEAAGKTILPGFIDAHMHPKPVFPFESPFAAVACGPDHVGSIEELVARLRKKAALTPPGQWVWGTGYQDTKLGRHPTGEDLDRASRAHPIMIRHSSGHLAVANSLALQWAGVNRETPDPAGGSFDRDDDGVPNGVLREAAVRVVREAGPERPRPTIRQRVAGYQRCMDDFMKQGITSIHIAGTSWETVELLQRVQAEGAAPRMYVMLREADIERAQGLARAGRLGDERLKLGAIKSFHGNSLSGRTCWLYEPYADRPDYHGIPPARSQEKLNELIYRIHEAGLQACVHANGDREIDMLLDAYEQALRRLPRADHRHRIEHCSVVNARILKRIQRLGIVLATHSYIHEHGDKMEAYGEWRWPWMHPNRSALELGIPVAGNSDWPVSAAEPLLRIQSMVTRTSAEGKVYGPEQRVGVEQAIRIWTLGGAQASFDEAQKGSITAGKLADFIVLSQDPRSVPAGQIARIQVELTAIGGTVVHPRPRMVQSP